MSVQRIERGDLWRSRARELQLRLRDRFRVAVDSHLHRSSANAPDGYFSSTVVQRWLSRFRDFRRESLHPPSAFYRKRVSKDFNAEEDSVVIRMLQCLAVPLIGNMCYVFMNGLNRVQVHGVEKLHDALLKRPKDKPLLTVSNHVAAVDDPFVLASLLPPRVLLDAENLRWTLCASDRCFTNPLTSAFFRTVKVLPVSRGDGIYQKGMDMAIAKLNSGGWVHIFPEGSRSRDSGKTMGNPKRGVGRLVLDADTLPVVIPFVHVGMHEIMPIGAKCPRIGKTVTVLVGDPIHFDDLIKVEGSQQISRGKLYDAVASRIGHRLNQLKVQVEKLALEPSTVMQHAPTGDADEATDILQQVDPETLGTRIHASADRGLRLKNHRTLDTTHRQQQTASGWRYEGGMFSMIRDMDSTELLGFAARGLFMSSRLKESTPTSSEIGPLRSWKQFLVANLGQWNTC